MSTRGLKFLDKWALKQLPIVARGEPLDASELKDLLRGSWPPQRGLPKGI